MREVGLQETLEWAATRAVDETRDDSPPGVWDIAAEVHSWVWFTDGSAVIYGATLEPACGGDCCQDAAPILLIVEESK